MKVIAIDFDGTITHNTPYPQRADIREEAKKYIPLLYKQGYKLVLWTARTTKYYNEVISRLKEENLFQYFTFDDVVVGFSGKIEADFYIDDKSYLGEFDWKTIYEYIINNIK